MELSSCTASFDTSVAIGLQPRDDHRVRPLRRADSRRRSDCPCRRKKRSPRDSDPLRAPEFPRALPRTACGFHPVEPLGVEGKSVLRHARHDEVAQGIRRRSQTTTSMNPIFIGNRSANSTHRTRKRFTPNAASSSRYFTNTTSFCFSLYRSSSTFACVSTNPKPPGRRSLFLPDFIVLRRLIRHVRNRRVIQLCELKAGSRIGDPVHQHSSARANTKCAPCGSGRAFRPTPPRSAATHEKLAPRLGAPLPIAQSLDAP